VPITEADGRLLLQRFSAFTAENGHWLKEEEDEQPFKTTPFGDNRWPFYVLTRAVSKVL
jgi:hypothetical protein